MSCPFAGDGSLTVEDFAAPPKRAVAGRAGRAGKMDTAARALHDDMYGSRDINAPGGRAPAGGGYARARGVRR